jgi:hypothetical protein
MGKITEFLKTLLHKISQFFKILFLGKKASQATTKPRPAICNQWLNVKSIWDNKKYKDFGLERIIRLALALSAFIFPALYIRDVFGRLGRIWRKLAVELYVLLKLILPILLFALNLSDNLWFTLLCGYMALETVLYLAALIFLSTEFSKPISYRRSLTTLFINYIEVCLDYAIIYAYCNSAIPSFFKEKLTTNIQAVYFSFATSATVGYGDIVVTNEFGQFLVISQIILFLVFVALFINFFASKVHDATDFNPPPTKTGSKKKSAESITKPTKS